MTLFKGILSLVLYSRDLLYSTSYYWFIINTIGILFKLGATPSHKWDHDVYVAVSTIVTTWLTVITKISIFCLRLHITSLHGSLII